MNTTNNQVNQNEASCCVDYCIQRFDSAAAEVVNVYKCNQKQFSVSESWNIQKSKKHVGIRPGL